MDGTRIFKSISYLLTAGLLTALAAPAATLQVDNATVAVTGSIQTQNVTVTASDGSDLPFDVVISYTQDSVPLWLSASAPGCTINAGPFISGSTVDTNCPTPAPLGLTLTNDLGHYGLGPFMATVTLTPHGGGTSVPINVTFYPGPGGIPGALTVTPSLQDPLSTVPIAYNTGQTQLPQQQVLVDGTNSYSLTVSTLSGGNWLLVGAGGSTGTQLLDVPASEIFTISLNQGNVVPLGTALYQGFVVVTGADGTSLATIAVDLSVNGGVNGAVTATPATLNFAYEIGASPVVVPRQTIVVSTPIGSTFTATTDHPEWIVLPSQASGPVPGELSVLINPSGLATTPNNYTGHITFTVGAATQIVTVQLAVTSSTVLWPQNQNGGTVLFTSQGSTATPASQSVVLATSDGSSPALSITSTPSWVSAALSGNTLTITPTVAGTAPAVLSDNVVITGSGVSNSPVSIPVLVVENGGGLSGPLTINPSSLTFNALAGGAAPDPQTLSVSAATTVAFNVSTVTTNGIDWLTVMPSFGGSTTTTLTVTVDPTKVPASVNPYVGAITLSVTNGVAAQTVPVTMTVSPAGGGNVTVDSTSVNLTAQIGTQKQTATVTVSNASGGTAPVLFNVTSSASWLKASPAQGTTQSLVTITADPTGLAAQQYQGQVTIAPVGGNTITINVTFTVQSLPVISASRTSFTFTYQSGGAVPAAQMAQISGGGFAAAVTSGNSWLSVSPATGSGTTNLTITVNPNGQSNGLHSGAVTVTGSNNTLTLTVTLNVTSPLPTVTSIVNGASFLPGAIAGGEVISLFGADLGPSIPATAQFDASGNLATQLADVQVLVNGYPAPMIYASSTQVTAVVPYEIVKYHQATVQVTYLNQRSNAMTLTIATTAPGIFTLNSSGTGPGARNTDFSPNGPNNQVLPGGYVTFYLTGEGPLDPAGVTGKINPTTGAAAIAALPIGVLIDNQPASWTYAGGIAGVVEGILQLNVQIPANARAGNLPVLVTIGGNGTQANVTVSVK